MVKTIGRKKKMNPNPEQQKPYRLDELDGERIVTPYSDRFSLKEAGTIARVSPPLDSEEEWLDVYDRAFTQAIGSGLSDAEARQAAELAQQFAKEKEQADYRKEVQERFGAFLTGLALKGSWVNSNKFGLHCRVYPSKTWRVSAEALRTYLVQESVSPFRFESLEEMLASGPYPPKEATLRYLRWLSDLGPLWRGAPARRYLDESFIKSYLDIYEDLKRFRSLVREFDSPILQDAESKFVESLDSIWLTMTPEEQAEVKSRLALGADSRPYVK